MLTDFRERGEGRRRERERNIDVRDKHPISCLICTPAGDRICSLGMSLTGNWPCDLLVYGMMLQPTEPHWPGVLFLFLFFVLVCILTASMSKGYFQIVPDYISALVQDKDKTVYICFYPHLFLTSASIFSHDSVQYLKWIYDDCKA